MTKVKKEPQRSGSKRHTADPYSLRRHLKTMKNSCRKKQIKASEKKEWRDAKCSVCMEYPHNAVLLLCSSYHKGCRPYMCATSRRYSNCLEQYKKAYTKVNSAQSVQSRDGSADDTSFSLGSGELLCPLCRGQVKGWTVVERARKFLNSRKRSCMQDGCSFVGSYKKLKKHVRENHPLSRPREVDPLVVEKWKKLEDDRELDDVISTINSTMPGAIIMGDYVIERRNNRGYSRPLETEGFFDPPFQRGSSNTRAGYPYRGRRHESYSLSEESLSDDEEILSDEEVSSSDDEVHVSYYAPRITRRPDRVYGTRRYA